MAATLQDIADRVAAIPGRVAETLASSPPELTPKLFEAQSYSVVGVGASAGPAIVLVETLRQLGFRARIRGPSCFLRRQQDPDDALVVFSQGLSPNARLATAHAKDYPARLLFTAVTEADESADRMQALATARREGMIVWVHGPQKEPGSLLRVLGPACATTAAMQFAAQLRAATKRQHLASHLDELSELPAVLAKSARLDDDLPHEPLAWLVAGDSAALAQPLAWKWQEALYRPMRPALDVLAFAHGPLQSLSAEGGSLVVLHRGTTEDLEILERLERVIDTSRQRVVGLRSSLKGPLRLLEDEVSVHRWMLAAMKRHGIFPGRWPAQGNDGPLYEVGRVVSKPV